MTSHQRGQALTEFVLIIPLFFVSIVSVVSLFSSMGRIFHEHGVASAVSLSEAMFSPEERAANHWEGNAASATLAQNIADAALNIRHYTSLEQGKDDGAKVTHNPDLSPTKIPAEDSRPCPREYAIVNNGLVTCANSFGYEGAAETLLAGSKEQSKDFRLLKMEFSNKTQTSFRPLFLPQEPYSLHNRTNVLPRAFHKSTSDFDKRIASTSGASFNSGCLMDYMKHENCMGPAGGLYVIYAQLAHASALLQHAVCVAEATKNGGLPGAAAGHGWEVIEKVFGGKESKNIFCPQRNKFFNALAEGARAYVKAVQEKNSLIESAILAELHASLSWQDLY